LEDEALFTTTVPRSLEMKTKLFGLDLTDVLIIFGNLSFTNLMFGATAFRVPIVWGSTVMLSALLFIVKRGKPDGYLQHYGEYLAAPDYRAAGAPDLKYKKRKDLIECQNR
jgi:hypothetical protein